MLKLLGPIKLITKKLIRYFPCLYLVLFIGVFFRKSLVPGLVPAPFDLLVNWFYPYNLGGWFAPGHWTAVKGGWFASDAIRQMYPWRELSVSLLKEGILPLWNPYNFSGTPLLANIQSSIFYPPTLIFYLTANFNRAWTIYIASSVVFAAFFMNRFLLSLKLSRLGALFGSIAFAASGYMIVWLEWGVMGQEFALIPLSLYSLNRWFDSGKRRFFFLLVLSLALTILAGYPQGAAYNFLIVGFWFLALLITKQPRSLKKIASVAAAFLLAVGLTAVQWLPTAELYFHSAMRGQVSQELAKNSALPAIRLVSILAPDYFGNSSAGDYWAGSFSAVDYMGADLYIGSSAFLFAFLAILNRRKIRFANSFFWLAGLGLALGLKSPLTSLISALNLPVVSTGSAASALQITVFALCGLAGLGIDFFQAGKRDSSLVRTVLALFGFYLVLAAVSQFLDPDKQAIALRSLAVPFFAFVFASFLVLSKFKPAAKSLLNLALILVVSFELLVHAETLLPFASPGFAFPRHPLIEELRTRAGLNRVDGFWENELSPNFQTILRLYSPEGYDPLYLRRYGELVAASETGSLPGLVPRSDADIVKNNDQNRNRIIDLTSVKYISAQVTNPEVAWEEEPLKYDPGRFRLVWQSGKFKIYENLKALPRVKLFSDWQVSGSRAESISALYSPEFDPHSQVVLEKDPGIGKSALGQASAEITGYQPNRVAIAIHTDSPRLLLITDADYPGWQARLDAMPVKILRANYAFRAVAVPAGEHRLEFIYRPLSFRFGLAVTLVSFLALLALAGTACWRTRMKPGEK